MMKIIEQSRTNATKHKGKAIKQGCISTSHQERTPPPIYLIFSTEL